MRARPAPTEMSNTTQRAVLDSSELERTASWPMMAVTCRTLTRRTVCSIHSWDCTWQLRFRTYMRHLGALENGDYGKG